MGERMKQKEKRKGSNGGSEMLVPAILRRSAGGWSIEPVKRFSPFISLMISQLPSTARNTPINMPTYADRRRQGLRESTLDPQLGFGPRIKIEPDSRSRHTDECALSSRSSCAKQEPSCRQCCPSWPTTPYGNTPTTQDASLFSTASTPALLANGSSPRLREGADVALLATSVSSNHCSVFDDDEEEDEDELQYDDGHGDNTKLKGVYWDGMGIFDSATPDMRRKRNQKKAYSVIQSLMATSELVDADGDGVRCRHRVAP